MVYTNLLKLILITGDIKWSCNYSMNGLKDRLKIKCMYVDIDGFFTDNVFISELQQKQRTN